MEIAIQIGLVLLGIVLQSLFSWLWKRWQERKQFLTGTWDQLIYDKEQPDDSPIKKDLVKCRQRGDIVEAEIVRFFPEDQKGRRWQFNGKFREGKVFGHFWAKDNRQLAFGTIYLRERSGRLAGYYIRSRTIPETWEKDTITVERIPLEWKKLTPGNS